MILCITEKPSVGRDLAKILGANVRRDGYLEGNGYYVSWTFGHLCTLKEPADYTENWKRWSLGSLPMIPPRFGIKLIGGASIEKQFNVLKDLVEKSDEVINCGDAGQEGELIQRWVLQKAGCKKKVSRLWISSLTDEAIREGFRKLRPSSDFDSLYEAGLCRAIGDWILGLNATRLYSLKYGVDRAVLSIGRVQTPTLSLVVQRQLEIENFVPQDSWGIRTKYRDVWFNAVPDPYKTEDEGNMFLEKIKDLPLRIDSVTRKKGSEAPPRLFDLTSLQVECNKKFGMSADATLQAIQSLYEKKLTTYPRVDTTYLTEDIYPKCKSILNSLKDYTELLAPLRGAPLKKSKKVFDNSKVTDHHAIIPTGQPLPSSLPEAESRVYDTIVKRFISAFYPDCLFQQTTVEASVSGEGLSEPYLFKATGKVITQPGWHLIYPVSKKDADGQETSEEMPAFRKGEQGPHEPELVKRTSRPPAYYTEGTLLKAMETAGAKVEDEQIREALKANGIGRPSTRAAIIEILFKRGYIKRVGKSLRATQAAIDLMGVIKEELLKSAELTGRWENKLRAVERGTYEPAKFIAEMKEMIGRITINVLKDNSNSKIKPDSKKR